ncbi:hypothetical protein HMPREF1092_01595 [Clostridium thermobutyricum]|uniref:DUF3785 domain-containing protein n=1 Tax=Clostridium thermobutyricum TaxID=29372 RepID=N9WHK4_9CLOT|nr:DUF3785 family protein [Clostridium thermobutyricum]ENZ02360.1 hypothetical protein HMPREF1092_01595 [Clostridium thermobutyricum]
MEYKFNFEKKEYILNEESLLELINDEESPVEGFDLNEVLRLLNEGNLEFDKAYYSSSCDSCDSNFKEKRNVSEYVEGFFYIYTKNKKYVIANIDKDYEGKTYHKLELLGEVDDSYIVSIIICKNCGKFIIQIEELVV